MFRRNPCHRNKTTPANSLHRNGCEGYSPSMFLPAKNEMTIHAQVESRREYFLQFNYVYTPDRYIGCGGSLEQVNVRRGCQSFHHPSSTLRDYGLLPPSKETPINQYKVWILLASSSSNSRNRNRGNNTINSWSSSWLLCISDGKSLQLGNGNNQENNWQTPFRLSPLVFQDTQAHSTRYVSTYCMMTEGL